MMINHLNVFPLTVNSPSLRYHKKINLYNQTVNYINIIPVTFT